MEKVRVTRHKNREKAKAKVFKTATLTDTFSLNLKIQILVWEQARGSYSLKKPVSDWTQDFWTEVAGSPV